MILNLLLNYANAFLTVAKRSSCLDSDTTLVSQNFGRLMRMESIITGMV